MSSYEEHPINCLKADALTVGSIVAEKMPRLAAPVIGSPSPYWVQAAWRHDRTRNLKEIHDYKELVDFEPEIDAGRVPAAYGRVALLSVRRYHIDKMTQDLGGQQAVAYALKTELMVGTALQGNLFDIDRNDSERYIVGMRIGSGLLRASMGYLHTDGMFEPFVDNLTHERKAVVSQDSVNVHFV
jgi:hypothetical protein